MITKDDALRLIADIAEGSRTANSLQHIALIARKALAEQPASKPWVGLTSKEREELDAEAWHFGPEAQYGMRVSEMTEAKLREKNAQQSKPQPLTGILSIARCHPDGQVVTVGFKTLDDAKAFEQYALEFARGIKGDA